LAPTQLGSDRRLLVEAASTHPVVELLRCRLNSKSVPGDRSDGHHLGLAIEGGGMRGVVSAGMLSALETIGALSAFDVVVGSSAGAFNAAYFVARQARYGTTIYYEDLTRHFIRLRAGGLRHGTVLDMDYLFDEVIAESKRLDVEAILESDVELGVTVSSIDERISILHRSFETGQRLLDVLRASIALPILAGPPVDIDGLSFTDGGLYEPFPFRPAISMGCDHVLVLNSRQTSQKPGKVTLSDRLARRMLRPHNDIGEDVVARHERYHKDLLEVQEATLARAGSPPFICSIAPGGPSVSRLETRHSRLVAAAQAGFRAIYEVILGQGVNPLEILVPAHVVNPSSPRR
jgi:predicted patatin/cPLA2 family phospholipase